MANDILFEVVTSLGFSVRMTHAYWELIVSVKHPVMREREVDVQNVFQTPIEIQQSWFTQKPSNPGIRRPKL